ncbi:Cytochrome P450 [Macrophomina phaseolina MS6]|uniref:Cytochrome P450 n=1 Tax=Macrophomina phaseolina (strain MS6) TaxID=1126212 RepID=K2RDQ6_MACPH|nr:Cytochrome P450 [Macrophomina phaseolina MS6]
MAILQDTLALVAQHPVLALLLFLLTYGLALVAYRLFLHPLAHFPGPKLAAATLWYEFYHDVVRNGQYTFEIRRMHEIYGPIVRISPHELHVNDPSYVDKLYVAGGKKRHKYEYFVRQFGIPDSCFSTVDHDLHRLRRGAMNRFFSKASVTRLEPLIRDTVAKLCAQIETYAGTGEPAKLNSAFSCMTTDIVTEYAFARSYNFLSAREFEPNFHKAITAGSDMGPLIKQLPWVLSLMRCLPRQAVARLNPAMAVYLNFQQDMRKQIAEIQSKPVSERKGGRTDATIFHELLEGNLPDREKTLERLWQEGQIIVGAGTETTAWTLSATIFYLLWEPATMERLCKELEGAMPDPVELPSLQRLEQLPYLSAVISEGLRLSYGVATRLQRVCDEPLAFASGTGPTGQAPGTTAYTVPAGTPVGMSCPLVHMNADLFPEPECFKPERWIGAPASLGGYILAFSKGSRQCVGINLAFAELYYGIAAVVRRFGHRLELFKTDLTDVDMLHDLFVPTPKLDTQGVRVLVR